MRPFLVLLPCSLALGLAASSVPAAVPSAANSTLPVCMALCPMGDMPFAVTVRDFANNPVISSVVDLDYSACPGAYLCTPMSSDPYTTDLAARRLRAVTDVTGSVTFPARVGGTGPAGSVRVYADGVLMRIYALASPDQDGNGVVASGIGADDPTFAAKLGTTDPTADFDCDGDVDDADQQIFFFHHSHACEGYVDPAQKSSWGRLKEHYR